MNIFRFLFPAMLLASTSLAVAQEAPPPATVIAERQNEWWIARHKAKLREISENADKIDLVFIGDSITQALERPDSAPLVAGTFPGMKILNLGYSADRTEHVLWRLRNGEIDGIAPKAAIVMIGTNNSGQRSDPPEITTKAIGMILEELRAKMPTTKIVLLSIFPRGDAPHSLNQKINALLPSFADGKTIFHHDINDAFLDETGQVPTEIMPDKLHPSAKGNALWMKALKPRLDHILAAPAAS